MAYSKYYWKTWTWQIKCNELLGHIFAALSKGVCYKQILEAEELLLVFNNIDTEQFISNGLNGIRCFSKWKTVLFTMTSFFYIFTVL